MGAIVGLGVGVGLLLIFLAYTSGGSERRRPSRRVGRLDALIHSAGIARLSRTGLVGASVGSAIVVFTVTVIVTAVPVVALLAGLAAASVPVVLLRRRVNQQIKARQAAQIAFADRHLDLPEKSLTFRCSMGGCLEPGSRIRVVLEWDMPLPWLPAPFHSLAHVPIAASQEFVVDNYRPSGAR